MVIAGVGPAIKVRQSIAWSSFSIDFSPHMLSCVIYLLLLAISKLHIIHTFVVKSIYECWLCLELGECVYNVDVSTSDRMLGGWREVLYQKLRQNYRGSAARMTKLNINIIPWPNFRRGARCWALGFLLGWRGGEQETCYRLLTFHSRDPTSAWTGTSLLSGGQRNLRTKEIRYFYHYQNI